MESQGFDTYANAIVFNQDFFSQFLKEYNNWYKGESLNGWLPRVWPEKLEGQTGHLEATINPIKISFTQGKVENVRLKFTLNKGTFSCNGHSIKINKWSFIMEGELGFDQALQLSEDECVYYKKSYSAIKERYNLINQFFIKLHTLRLAGEIDYGETIITEELKAVFSKNVQLLLTNYIAKHENFVLLYLGCGLITKEITPNELYFLFPNKTYFQIYNNTITSEVRFPFRWLMPISKWYGETNKPLVLQNREGCFILGRESFFSVLLNDSIGASFVKNYNVNYKEGKVNSIELDVKKDKSITHKIVQSDENTIVVDSSFELKESFNFPDLGDPKQSHINTISYSAKRKFEIKLSFNYKSNEIIITCTDQSIKGNDVITWKNDTGEMPIVKNTNLFNSILLGDLTHETILDITLSTCGHALIACDKIIAAYRQLISLGHNAYHIVSKPICQFDLNFRLPVTDNYIFIQLPESELVSFEKIHFDSEWNVYADIKQR